MTDSMVMERSDNVDPCDNRAFGLEVRRGLITIARAVVKYQGQRWAWVLVVLGVEK